MLAATAVVSGTALALAVAAASGPTASRRGGPRRLAAVTRERAVILARGLGTRMRQATDGDVSRPDQARGRRDRRQGDDADAGPRRDAPGLVAARSRPFLDYILSALADAGYTDVCLVVAPDHEAMARHYAGAGRRAGCGSPSPSRTSRIGTANAVAAAEAWTGDDPFLVINGDNYYAVRTLASLVGRAGAATALYPGRDAAWRGATSRAERIRAFALGVVEDGRLARIVEKPTPEQAAALGGTRSSA